MLWAMVLSPPQAPGFLFSRSIEVPHLTGRQRAGLFVRAIQVLAESEKPECANEITDQIIVPFLTKREMIQAHVAARYRCKIRYSGFLPHLSSAVSELITGERSRI